jgi:hypothetical protein
MWISLKLYKEHWVKKKESKNDEEEDLNITRRRYIWYDSKNFFVVNYFIFAILKPQLFLFLGVFFNISSFKKYFLLFYNSFNVLMLKKYKNIILIYF